MVIGDVNMLYSMINMKLRDQYDSLDELCACEDLDLDEVIAKLKDAGYEYNPDINQLR